MSERKTPRSRSLWKAQDGEFVRKGRSENGPHHEVYVAVPVVAVKSISVGWVTQFFFLDDLELGGGIRVRAGNGCSEMCSDSCPIGINSAMECLWR